MDILDMPERKIELIAEIDRKGQVLCACSEGDGYLCDFCSDVLFLFGDGRPVLGVIDTPPDLFNKVKT